MKPFASFANLCAFAGARAALRFLALLTLGVSALFIVDATDWALPFETWLAGQMAEALRAVCVGVGADPALMGTVAPSCAGVRTALAAAILGACLAPRRKLLGAAVGAACGLGLNFVRLVAVEAALRVDHAAGMILHDLALYAIVLPAALAAWPSGASAPSLSAPPSPPPPSPSPPSSSPSTSPTRERRSQRPTEASTEKHRESNGWNPPSP